ncbi:MAG: electron transfer flavoprotein subunit alpha/FixB family protein [Candidatus Aminicenantes bacterium]|jgi:electron transfer flavoprotein alpha subunit
MKPNRDISKYNDVLICGEATNAQISSVTAELIHAGRTLSNTLGGSLHVLLIGEGIEEAAAAAITLGADKVHLASGDPFEETSPESFVRVIAQVCARLEPWIIIFGQTDMGRDVAPRLAARLNVPVTLDCIRLEVDPQSKSIHLTKPVFGGNAMAVWKSADQNTQIASMRPRVTEPAKPDDSRQGEILIVQKIEEESPIKEKLLQTAKEESKGIRLEDAKVVVAGGGGIGSGEGFRLIGELAQILRGAVGTSHVPSDEGWMPKNLEIGQTGHMVSPDVYIAVGISGAPQHMAGCSGSKFIVSINKDPEANIFKESDLGLVGDYKKALPPLIQKLKSMLDV